MCVGIIQPSIELGVLPAIKSFLPIDLLGFETDLFLNSVYKSIILFVSHCISQIAKDLFQLEPASMKSPK